MSAPDSPDVLERLHSLVARFHRRMHEAVRDDGEGIAIMEARALNHLARHDGSTQRDLVAHTGRDKAQIARIVKALTDRGLIEGSPDLADRRVLRLHPTTAGRAMHRRMQQHRQRFAKDMTRGFSIEELVALQAQLDRLLGNVSEP
ncbi:MAG TPA: MarR family transcriptional regulator [Hydrogenophaga sp.]|nr:MarR family transcriptional regulator [Hydrogenophaga sp.]